MVAHKPWRGARTRYDPDDKSRSTSEKKVIATLKKQGVVPGVNSEVVEYIQPATRCRYIADLALDNGILLEVKGYWPIDQRQKMMLVIKHNPQADIRMVFDTPHKTISKTSKTTYAAFCDKHGIKWCKTGEIPPEWLHGCTIDPFLLAQQSKG